MKESYKRLWKGKEQRCKGLTNNYRSQTELNERLWKGEMGEEASKDVTLNAIKFIWKGKMECKASRDWRF